MLAVLTICAALAIQTTRFDHGLYLPVRQTRAPIPSDPVIESLVRGTWTAPSEATGWKVIKAKENGWFEDDALEGAYVDLTLDADRDKVVLLDAAGHSLVYVNGVPRAGDPYGYEYLTLPVSLHEGTNELLFVCGRGRLKASVRPIENPIELDTRDLTIPDVIPTDDGVLQGAVVVRNCEPNAVDDLMLDVGGIRTKAPRILGESVRKVPFGFAVPKPFPHGKLTLDLKLYRGDRLLDKKAVDVRVRSVKQTYKRTFVSRIDGSVQYYVVNPAQQPGPGNALILSVHGASVEATSQADAYASKPDVTVVAATNRRPYGFDWEDWGRIDALEVLDQAKRTIPHDPLSVHLTGHSMGGHGAWYIGTLYPNLFASVMPAAGWISWWSYGGGWSPNAPKPTEVILRRAMSHLDPLGRLTNTLAQGVFVLHGDADDNVPVTEARKMKSELEKIHHPDFGYHEVPGAGHWWSNAAVDWPDFFTLARRRRLDPWPAHIDFITPNPAISSTMGGVRIEQQLVCLEPSRIVLDRSGGQSGWELRGTTQNVAKLTLLTPAAGSYRQVVLDGQTLLLSGRRNHVLSLVDGKWIERDLPGKSSERSGPFKQAFDRNMLFVYGTGGTREENEWAWSKARYDAESWYYRGNGSVDVVPDTAVGVVRDRNVILYGNRRTNRVWGRFLAKCPIHVDEGQATFDVGPGKAKTPAVLTLKGDMAVLFLYPFGKSGLVGVVGGTSIEGMRRTNRIGYLSPASAYPDWILIDRDGILGDGFFGNNWKIDAQQLAWR